jgi:AraC-like DNA-binding protein
VDRDLAALESLRLRIELGGGVSYPPGTVIGPRRIRDFELVWVDAGTATFAGPEGEVVLDPGRVLLVRPGERHIFRMDRRRMLRHGFVHFSVQPATVARRLMAWPRSLRLAPGSLLAATLASLERRLPGGADQPVHRQLLRTALVLYRDGGAEPEPAAGELDPQVAAVLGEVGRRWRETPAWSPQLSELATIAGLSASALGRIFRAAFGCGPVAAIRRWQIERAARLLGGDTPITAIARDCGWRDPDRFARAFRAAYGISPRLARMRIREGVWMPLPRLTRLTVGAGRRYPSFPANDPSLPA